MPRDRNKPGTVGKPLTEVELKIDPGTGEILMRAEWLMEGYFKEPEKTAEVIRDGWLHTGDCGEIDEEGFLKITGRLSDAFKTAKGMFIYPGPLEEQFGKLPYAEQVCVVGLGQLQPLVLISLSEMGQKEEPQVVEQAIRELLKRINEPLPTYQKIAKAVLTTEAWSVDNSLLTPTLKIRRRQIDIHYGDYYEQWLMKEETVIWL
jgi:long-subunit acyl-CoA synthetase (AMP-forming)